MLYIKGKTCKTSYCQGRMFCCKTRLIFLMRGSIMPSKPAKVHSSLFSLSLDIITKSFRIPGNTFNQSLHDITFFSMRLWSHWNWSRNEFGSFWILFKWQNCVLINYDGTVRLFTYEFMHALTWLDYYCVTHLILDYSIIRYINYSQVPFNFSIFALFVSVPMSPSKLMRSMVKCLFWKSCFIWSKTFTN